MDRKKRLRATGKKVYINENLTKQNRELLVKAKDWAKGKGFLYVWHENDKIFVRRKDLCDQE